MYENAGKKITFILYKNSIVVRGLLRPLEEKGFKIELVEGSFENLEQIYPTTDLFIIYLPEGLEEDEFKKKQLHQICDRLNNAKPGAIIIGEKIYKDSIQNLHPYLKKHLWINKPVETASFCEIVDKTLTEAVKLDVAETVSDEMKRVLIIDDDASYAGMVRAWIKNKYKVNILTSGSLAIPFLKKTGVDIILLDYEMPGLNGPQVLQLLRQDETTKNIPVLFLTGVSTKEEVESVMKLKPDGYILKTTPRENILAYLEKKLDK